MSMLIYEGKAGQLTLFDRDGKQVDVPWKADNNVTHEVRRKYGLSGLPNGDYLVRDRHYPSHDGPPEHYTWRGAVGPTGMFKLKKFQVNGVTHEYVGVHAGRNSVHDPTELCIRTTGTAMSRIRATALHDPITVLQVRGNDTVPGRPHPCHR